LKKNVLILGASAPIAKYSYEFLKNDPTVNVTLFLRNPDKVFDKERSIIGDAMNLEDLVHAMKGIDIVYSCLGPYNMVPLAKNVIEAMNQNKIKRVYWMATLGIYGEVDFNDEEAISELGDYRDPDTYLGDQRIAADLIENSNLDFTIIRPNWLTDQEIIEDIRIENRNGKSYIGEISRQTVGKYLATLINEPTTHMYDSIALTAKEKIHE